MKKYTWIVVLLLALSLAFFGCGGGDDDDDGDDDGTKTGGGDGEGGGFKIIAELGEFTFNNGETQKGWERDSGEFTADAWGASKYLVLKLEVPADGVLDNKDGYGGIDFVINSDLTDPTWQQTEIINGWVPFARTSGETNYIVVDLTKVKGYNADISTADYVQIAIGYYGKPGGAGTDSITTLGIKTAYLVDDKGAKPAGAVNLTSADYGYICKDLVLTP